MRYRVVIDLDTTDPDTTATDVEDAVRAAIDHLETALPGAWVDPETIEEMGT